MDWNRGGWGSAPNVDLATAEKIARNNATFRKANDEIGAAAAQHGLDDGRLVPFLCECSDGGCTEIITLTLVEYERVRSNDRWFAHAAGHEEEVPGAVRLVEAEAAGRYRLVEKVGRAGEVASRLAAERPTD